MLSRRHWERCVNILAEANRISNVIRQLGISLRGEHFPIPCRSLHTKSMVLGLGKLAHVLSLHTEIYWCPIKEILVFEQNSSDCLMVIMIIVDEIPLSLRF